MASNFKISAQEAKNWVQLNLTGDFDGSSAQQLLYCLRKYTDSGRIIVVDTSFLRKCDAFGLNLFRYHLSLLKHQREKLAFTGSKAHVLTGCSTRAMEAPAAPLASWRDHEFQ